MLFQLRGRHRLYFENRILPFPAEVCATLVREGRPAQNYSFHYAKTSRCSVRFFIRTFEPFKQKSKTFATDGGVIIMQMIIFLEDLKVETLNRIKWVLRHELQDEIAEALKNGVDPGITEEEILNDYMNRNNRGTSFEL